MKKIFLTGGTGFFGKSMMEYGFPLETEVTILSREPDCFKKKYPAFAGFRFVKGDVRDFTFPDESFEWIIHGAATASPSVPDGETRSVIVDGTRRVLDFAKKNKTEKILFISSGAVYGIQDPGLDGIPESMCPNPATVYGKAKYEAEKMCFQSGIPTVVARCFAFIGKYLPRERTHFAAGSFLNDAIHGRPVEILGDGRNFRSYLDADDLVAMLWKILLEAKSGEIYNVGSSRAISIRELAEHIVSVSGRHVPIRIHTQPGKERPARYVPDIHKIKNELGISPEIPLEESIRKVLASVQLI